MLLLDTHAALWMVEGRPMSDAAKKAIGRAAATDSVLFSAVSGWEIGLLVEKQKFALSIPVRQWIERLAALPGITVLPLDMEIAVAATELPQPFVHDPADRFLVATARTLAIPIVTRDMSILDYAAAGHVVAIEC